MALVLTLHSGGFSSRQWRKLVESLGPGHRVLNPDLLGYGTQPPWPAGEPFHFQQDLDAVEALLAAEGAPAHLVGHSYGGFLALKLALARPDLVRSLALYEPVAFGILDEPADEAARRGLTTVKTTWEPDPEGVDEGWLEAFVDWWNGPGAWKALAPPTRATFRATGWKVFQEVMSLAADRTGRQTWATIAAPTLLLGGGRSPYTERRVLEKLAAALPNATLRMFEDAGHMGPLTHADAVNGAVAEWIARASAAPRG